MGNDWTLVLHLPAKMVFSAVYDLRNTMAKLMLALGGAGIFFAAVFSKTVSRPIAKLEKATKRVRDGDLDVRKAYAGI